MTLSTGEQHRVRRDISDYPSVAQVDGDTEPITQYPTVAADRLAQQGSRTAEAVLIVHETRMIEADQMAANRRCAPEST
ncbi:hypothetical protein [Nocardia macrotermitis]|uniref:hypothetical protein n=1 Tax=Nocardia macrotermitis TaxID=2585198 RepID=UPI0012974C64|nr:hypothetical protein [Nocardia macrotermitis]